MSLRDDSTRIRDMPHYARLAVSVSAEKSRSDLESDPVFRAASERFIEIIGEAAARLSDKARTARPEVPWEDIIGARNVFAHGYYTIDPDVLWRILRESLPDLIAKLDDQAS